jgi:hypothetical protein
MSILLDHRGRPIKTTVADKTVRIGNKMNAHELPNGCIVSVKNFLSLAKKVESDERFRVNLEKAERQTGRKIWLLMYNRASEDDKRKILRHMRFGEKINREQAQKEGMYATLKGYNKIDAMAA